MSIRYYKGLFEEMSIGYNTSVELARIEFIYIGMLDSKRRIDMVGEYRELFMVFRRCGVFLSGW